MPVNALILEATSGLAAPLLIPEMVTFAICSLFFLWTECS